MHLLPGHRAHVTLSRVSFWSLTKDIRACTTAIVLARAPSSPCKEKIGFPAGQQILSCAAGVACESAQQRRR